MRQPTQNTARLSKAEEEATPDNSATNSSWGKGKSRKKVSSSETTKATRPEAKKRRKQEIGLLGETKLPFLF